MFDSSEASLQFRWNARLAFLLPLAGYALYLSAWGFGHPNPIWALLLLLFALGAGALAWLLALRKAISFLDALERHATLVAVALMGAAALVLVAASCLQIRYFAAGAQAEDTAYYSQVLWNTLHGNFLSGNVQQARLFNPPLTNDFALHFSPFLVVILLPVYAVSPHALTLLIARDLALAAAAWPLFLLARDRLGGTAGVAAVILYLANPAVIAQGLEAFYLLHFAPLPFFWALRAYDSQKFRAFAFWTITALAIREDIAITIAGLGLLALFRRRKWNWLAVSLALPVVWWLLATLVLQPAFGRSGNSTLDVALAGGQKSPLGIYETLLGGPAWISEALRGGGLAFLFFLLRPVAFLGVLGLEGVIAFPVLLATIFLGRVFYQGGDPFSRFALLPSCALIAAAVLIMCRLSRRYRADKRAFALTLICLLPSPVLLDGAKEAVRGRLLAFTVSNDAAALREALRLIPLNASVAAPNYALPALSKRRELFYLQYLHMYPATQVDYVLFDRNLDRIAANPELRERYLALRQRLSHAEEYETIWQKGDYSLLRRKARDALSR